MEIGKCFANNIRNLESKIWFSMEHELKLSYSIHFSAMNFANATNLINDTANEVLQSLNTSTIINT